MKKALWIGTPILAVILIVCGYVSFGAMTYSEGDRVGTVVKFSHKGIGFKTWEGELHMGSMMEGGVPSVWTFSVDDEKVVDQVQNAQTSTKRVKLHYKEQMWKQSWRGSTHYFVVGVEYLDNQGEKK